MVIFKKLLALIIITFIFFSLTKAVLYMYLAETSAVKAVMFMEKGEYMQATKFANKSLTYNPYEPNYYRQRAKVNLLGTTLSDEQLLIDTGALKAQILSDLTLALALNPQNLATIRNNAPLYFFLGNKDLSKASLNNIDEEYISYSEEYMSFLKNYAPDDLGVQVLAAKYEKRLNLEGYSETYNRINLLRPDLIEWYPDLQ